MARVTPLRAAHHSIATVPQVIKNAPQRTKIKLKIALRPVIGLDGEKAVASIKRRKKRKKHLYQLERLIAENACPRKYFRPLEKYLIQKIRQGKTTQDLCLATLLECEPLIHVQ